jgi:hypothetical protein
MAKSKAKKARLLPALPTTALVVAWLVLIAGVIYASVRGLNPQLFGDFVGKVIIGASVASFVGISSSVDGRIRAFLQRLLFSGVGRWVVPAVVFAVGLLLVRWSYQRVRLQLACKPAELEVWIDGDRKSSACRDTLWVAASANVFARSEGYEAVQRRAADLPVSAGRNELTLAESARWSCSLHGGAVDDEEVFSGCGESATPWVRSRTWSLNATIRENARASAGKRPRLLVSSEAAGVGVAIQSVEEHCFVEGDDQKDPTTDGVNLVGCGNEGSYSVDVTVCVTDNQQLSTNADEWMTIRVQENIDDRPYECVLSGAVSGSNP